MPNQTVPLPSGAKLELQMPPFKLGTRLYKVFAAELKSAPIDLSMDLGSLKEMADGKKPEKSVDLGSIKGMVLQVLASDSVEDAVFDCLMAGCLYDGARINRDTFEPERARGDWLPAAWEVIRFTLAPFFGSLASAFAASRPAPTDSQKST